MRHDPRCGIFAKTVIVMTILTFASTAHAASFNIFNSSNPSQTFFTVNGTTGNIGIGTTNPTYLLDVTGGINSSGLCLSGDCKTAWSQVSGSSTAGGWTNDSTTTSTALSVNVNSGKLFVNATSGNVGIGTTSPTSKLEVTGDANISTNFAVGRNNFFVNNGTGRVGVGTTNPQNTFEVFGVGIGGVGNPIIRISNNASNIITIGTDNGYGAAVRTGTNALNLEGISVRIGANTNADPTLVVTNNRRVGINNTAPLTLLDVNGTFRVSSVTGTTGLYQGNTGNVGIGDASPDVLLSVGSNTLAKTSIGSSVIKVGGRITASDVQEIGFGGDDSTATPMSAIGNIVIDGASYAKGALYFATRDVTTNTAPTERMRITNSGNVGIGTTAPEAKLSFVSSAAGTNELIKFQNNLGAVDSALSVYETAVNSHTLFGSNIYMTSGGFARYSNSYGSAGIITNVDGVSLVTGDNTGNPSTRLYIQQNGNVGIGTTSPNFKLDVAGTISGNIDASNITSGTLSDSRLSSNIARKASDETVTGRWTFDNDVVVNHDLYLLGNLTTTNVNTLNVNGSIRPPTQFDNTFDLGSSTARWASGYFGSGLAVSGTANVSNIAITTKTTCGKLYTDSSGNVLCGSDAGTGGSSLPAANITSGTFSAGDYTFPNNVVVNRNLTVGGNNLFVDNNTGRVGIGTTNPQGKLEIGSSGNLRFFSSTDATPDVSMGYISANSRNAAIDELAKIDFRKGSTYYSGEIAFSTAADMAAGALLERMRIDKNGKVGIGTTVPTAKLNVALVQADNASASDATLANSFLQLGGGEYASGRYFLTTYGYSTGRTNPGAYAGALGMSSVGFGKYALVFGTRDVTTDTLPTERMRIDTNGNVGIGTTAPNFLLHLNAATAGDYASALQFTNSGTGSTSTDGVKMGLGNTKDFYFVNQESVGNAVWKLNSGDRLVLQPDGSVGLGGSISSISTLTGSALMIQGSSGNVGIGTTSPLYKLDVNGSAADYITKLTNTHGTSGYGLQILAGDSDSERILSLQDKDGATRYTFGAGGTMYINGNVGIGTTSPGEKLDVQGNIKVPRGNALRFTGGSGDAYIQNVDSSGGLRLQTNNADAMYIDVNRNVGIGTTNPTQKLDVAGNVNASALCIAGDCKTAWSQVSGSSTAGGWTNDSTTTSTALSVNVNSGKLFVNATSGSVGIGTTSPGSIGYASKSLQITDGSNAGVFLERTATPVTAGMHLNSGARLDFLLNQSSTLDANSIRMSITSTGNVGIGTTSPGAKLELGSGQIFVPDGTASAPSYSFTNDNDTGIIRSSSNVMDFVTGNVIRFSVSGNQFGVMGTANGPIMKQVSASSTTPVFIFEGDSDTGIGRAGADVLSLIAGGVNVLNANSSGNVGINTTSPQNNLHINDATGGTIRLSKSGNSGWATIQGDNNLMFSTGVGGVVSEAMRITQGGNVGINTTSPSNLLHLVKNSDSTTLNDGTNGNYPLRIDNNQAANVTNIHTGIWLRLQNGLANRNAFITLVNNPSSNTGDITFSSTQTGTETERMRISGSGNVGIGTTTPQVPFEVSNSGAEVARFTRTGSAGANIKLWSDSTHLAQLGYTFGTNTMSMGPYGQTTALAIDNSGNVGIGTTAPEDSLHISTATNSIRFGQTSGNEYSRISYDRSGDTTLTIQNAYGGGANARINFAMSSGNAAMTILRDGNVGIGTTASGHKLSVVGAANTLTYQAVNAADVLSLTADGGSNIDFRSGNSVSSGILWSDPEARAMGNLRYQHSTNKMEFYTNGASTANMVIDSSGNIGIGTPNPTSKLHINSSMGTASGSPSLFRIENDYGSIYGTIRMMQYEDAAGGYLSFSAVPNMSSYTISNITSEYGAGRGASAIESINGNLIFHVTTSSAANSKKAMYISNAGNVGIGTTSPGAKLDIATPSSGVNALSIGTNNAYELLFTGTGTTNINSPTSDIYLSAGTSKKLYLAGGTNDGTDVTITGGNVGIGTTSPGNKLEIYSPSNGLMMKLNVGGVNVMQMGSEGGVGAFDLEASGSSILMAKPGTYGVAFGPGTTWSDLPTNGNINLKGNVGIGTASPNFKLDVAGTISGSIDASNITSGTLSDSRLSSNIARKASDETVTGRWTFDNDVVMNHNLFVLGNITNTNVNNLSVNGSILPPTQFDNIFNIGSSAARWGTGYFGTGLSVNGTATMTDAKITSETSCSKLYTDSNGNVMCGTDSGISGITIPASNVTAGTFPAGTYAFAGASSNALVVNGSTGYVGVGTASPGQKLHVSGGNMQIDDGYGIYWGSNAVISRGSGSAPLIFQPTRDITFRNSGGTDTFFWNNTNGNVGIGTTGPGYSLTIAKASGNPQIALQRTTDVNQIWAFGIDASKNFALQDLTSGGDVIKIIQSSHNLGLVTDGGNVGIGTTSPLVSLHAPNGARLGNLDLGVTYGSSIQAKTGNSPVYIQYNNTGNLLLAAGGGNVGIGGDFTPISLLQVMKNQNGITSTYVTNNDSTNANSRARITTSSGNSNIVNTTIESIGSLNIGYIGTTSSHNLSIMTGSATRMTLDTNGNVGIGTTAPATTLNVVGTIRAERSGQPTQYTELLNDGTAVLRSNQQINIDGGGVVAFKISNAEKVRIDNSGNVGIGTTAPNAKLQVGGTVRLHDANQAYALYFEPSGASNIGFGKLGNEAAPWTGSHTSFAGFTPSTADLLVLGYEGISFGTRQASDKLTMRINSNGNVGIGITTPAEKLVVNGKMLINTNTMNLSDWNYDSGSNRKLGVNGGIYVGTGIYFEGYGYSALTGNNLRLHAGSIQTYSGDTTLIAGSGDNYNASTSIKNYQGGSLTTQMFINGSTGKVGIGTTSPTEKLTVSGDIAGTNLFVGGGNRSGGYNMGGGISGSKIIFPAESSDQASMYSTVSGGTTTLNLLVGDDPADGIKINTINSGSGYGYVALQSDGGNVGIGTTSPTDKLDVRPSVNSNYASNSVDAIRLGRTAAGRPSISIDTSDTTYTNRIWMIENNGPIGSLVFSRNGLDVMTLNNAGNVGIGTTAPGQKLYVSTNEDTDTFKGIMVENWAIGNTGSRAGIAFKAYDWVQSAIWHARGGANSGALILGTNPDTADLTVAGVVPRMTIVNSGNVGIGTTAPGQKLQIENGSISLAGSTNKYIRYNSASNWQYYLANSNDDFRLYDSNSLDFIRAVYNGGDTNKYLSLVNGTMIVKNNGNVGIGTTSPNFKLDVAGTISGNIDASNITSGTLSDSRLSSNIARKASDETVTGRWTFDNDVIMNHDLYLMGNITTTNVNTLAINGSILPSSQFDNTFDIGSSTARWRNGYFGTNVTVGGNVGIGTTGPGAKLHVLSSGDVAHELFDTSATTNKRVRINFAQNGTQHMEIGTDYALNNIADLYIYNRATGQTAAYFNPGGNVWFNPTGNVGIGTTSPNDKLQVGSTGSNNLSIQGSVSNEGRGILFRADDNSLRAKITHSFTDYATTPGNLKFYAESAASVPTLALTLTGAGNALVPGNVGIGTTAPSEKLEVNGTIRVKPSATNGYATITGNANGAIYSSNGDLIFYTNNAVYDTYFKNANGAATNMIIKDSGNVGIGTTSPTAKLQVAGGDILLDNDNYLRAKDTGGTSRRVVSIDSSNFLRLTTTSTGLRVLAQDESTELVRIQNNGNVGIGTTSPGQKLSVAGTIESTSGGYKFPDATTQKSGGYEIFPYADITVSYSGGWTSPSYMLKGGGNWHSDSAASGDWAMADMGRTFTATMVDFSCGLNGEIKLEGSADNSSWTTLFQGKAYHRQTLVKNSNGYRYYRINKTVQASSEWCDKPVRFYGYEGSVPNTYGLNLHSLSIDETSGNVGIGTTNPTYKLDVVGTINASNVLINGSSISSSQWTTTGSNIYYNTGNVGIGTASPSSTLTVVGNINVTGNIYLNQSLILNGGVGGGGGGGGWIVSGNDIYSPNIGNVGIGTTIPNATLEVVGGMRMNTNSTKPTCNAGQRGTMWFEQSSPGTDDFMYACMRNSTSSYNWVLVARGS